MTRHSSPYFPGRGGLDEEAASYAQYRELVVDTSPRESLGARLDDDPSELDNLDEGNT